jgi:hypothetical protein
MLASARDPGVILPRAAGTGAPRSAPVGQLIPIPGTDGRTGRDNDSFAYLANPLPREVVLSSSTWTAVASAEASLARLDQAARQIPQPALLYRPALLESEVEERAQLSLEIREILN